jgi:hypothetical protein
VKDLNRTSSISPAIVVIPFRSVRVLIVKERKNPELSAAKANVTAIIASFAFAVTLSVALAGPR